MSRIDELIKEKCPNGVEYKELGSVIEITKGIQFNKENMNDEGTYPVINGGINPSGYIEQYNNLENTITISQGGASAGFVNWITTKFWAGAHCYVVKPLPIVDVRYIYHFLKSQEYKLKECQYGAGIPALSKATVTSLEIPVPPIEIQQEIVRILDKFTELEAELQAELDARKKQYEYYRDELLTLPETSRMSLSSITLKVGSIDWKKYNSTKKYIDLSSVDRETHTIIDDDVIEISSENAPSRAKQIVNLFGGTRPMLKRYCKVSSEYDEQVCSTGYCVLRVDNKIALTNYVYYCLGTSEFYRYVESNQQGASYPAIGDTVLKAYEIPIPSIEIQKKIVENLDYVDNLCDDIEKGLPAEIEARHKQYEYYRDKLLTFERKVV